MRSLTSTSCGCRPTWNGMSGVCVVLTASRRWTKRAPASYATNNRTASEIMSGTCIQSLQYRVGYIYGLQTLSLSPQYIIVCVNLWNILGARRKRLKTLSGRREVPDRGESEVWGWVRPSPERVWDIYPRNLLNLSCKCTCFDF